MYRSRYPEHRSRPALGAHGDLGHAEDEIAGITDRGYRRLAAAGAHRVVAGGLHHALATAEQDCVVAAAGKDRVVAAAEREDGIVAHSRVD